MDVSNCGTLQAHQQRKTQMSKYKKWYDAIITNAQTRTLPKGTYVESHHIIPRSFGGANDPSNLVNLTAREHFLCHCLLFKLHTGEHRAKMAHAVRMMALTVPEGYCNEHYTARVYESMKIEYAKMLSERFMGEKNPMYGLKHSEATKEKLRQANLGRIPTAETRAKIGMANRGKKRPPPTPEASANMSAANTGENNPMYGKQHSDETKQKIRERAVGRKQSPETIAKKAAAIRGTKRERKICPHCDKDVAVNIYAKNHGDNCKYALHNVKNSGML